jgi:hypothetical protein
VSAFVTSLSGLYGETCYVLLRDHFSNPLFGAAPRSNALPIEWLTKWPTSKGARSPVDSKYVRMSQLKRIHALRTVSADLFEMICQIRGDELDGAGTHERKLKQLPIWDVLS